MPLIVNHLLLVTGVILSLLGLLGNRLELDHALFLSVGITVLALAFVSDWRRAVRAKKQRQEAIESRIHELTLGPWGTHQTLRSKGSIWIGILSLTTLLISVYATYTGLSSNPINWRMSLSAAFFVALCLFPTLLITPNIFKPVLELSISGFATPIHGSIAWAEVGGIVLLKRTHKGITYYTICFRVDKYSQAVTNMHWSERLFALFRVSAAARGQVRIRIPSSPGSANELPEVVYAVARHLWKQTTGNNYDWHPDFSNEYNEASRELSEVHSKRHVLQDLQPEEMLAELEQVKNLLQIQTAELVRHGHKLNRQTWIALALFLLTIALWAWSRLS